MKGTPQSTRAAIYCRISRDDQDDQLGVERQERNCRRIAAERGWQVIEPVYVDNDLSASNRRKRRPDFERLLADIDAGTVDVVLVQDQDRLNRDGVGLELAIERLRAAGHDHFWTVSGRRGIVSATDRLHYRTKAIFDQGYADFISEKVRDKKDELAEKGVPAGGGTRPFGYLDGGLEVCEPEADAIRDAARRVLDGESLGSIVADWNANGPSTVKGGRWTINVLRTILGSLRVAGRRQHRDEDVGAAVWPAILDADTHERLVTLFASPTRRHAQRVNRRLLTGILHCGKCGTRLVGGSNNGAEAYVCRRPLGGCGGLAIRGPEVDELVGAFVVEAVDGGALADVIRSARRGGRSDDVVAIEAQMAELAEAYGAGTISMADWLIARRGVEERLAAARDRAADAAVAADLEPYAKRGALAAAWPTLSTERRRTIIGALFERIDVAPAVRGRHRFDPDRLSFVWKV